MGESFFKTLLRGLDNFFFASNHEESSNCYIIQEIKDHTTIEKCSCCGFVISQKVGVQSGYGAGIWASSESTIAINDKQVCGGCGKLLQYPGKRKVMTHDIREVLRVIVRQGEKISLDWHKPLTGKLVVKNQGSRIVVEKSSILGIEIYHVAQNESVQTFE